MTPFMKVLFGACSIVALGACARTNGSKAADEANQQIEQVRKDMDAAKKSAADAGKAGEDAGKQAQSAYEQALDQTASGSQPGQVILEGALVDGAKPAEKITVTQTAGTGWRGTTPKLIENALLLNKESKIPISVSSGALNMINFGCDLSKYPEAKDLTPKEAIKTDSATLVNAALVLICDGKLLGDKAIVLRAPKLVLANAQIEVKGITGVNSVEIAATEMVLEGENKITTSAADASSTLFAAPTITVGAKELKGEGTLAISSTGSSYKESKTETQASPETPETK